MDNITIIVTVSAFVLSLVIQLVSVGIIIGVYKTTINFMQKQIEEIKKQAEKDKCELKEDMRKYNNVLERVAINEQKASSAHHRIDMLEEKR